MANIPLSGGDESGLAPVLDLLSQMENQVGGMTQVRPANSFGADGVELRTLREDLLSADQRGYEQLARFTQSIGDLKAAIPHLIEESVGVRFVELEDAFQRNIKEIHARSMDAFTQSMQSKIGQRVASLENSLTAHAEARGQLREQYLEMDRNVQRLMSGLDRLTAELARQPASSVPPVFVRPPAVAERPSERLEVTMLEPKLVPPEPDIVESKPVAVPEPAETQNEPIQSRAEEPQRIRRTRKVNKASRFIIPAGILAVLVPLGLIGWQLFSGGAFVSSTAKTAVNPAAQTAIASQLQQAADFSAAKDYARAENIYREVVRTDPSNRTAVKELASVLFRQQKYEEAATVLKTLPPE